MDILTLFSCFETLLAATSRRQLVIIANAVLTMTGQVTMLGISRWTSKGGSYRTIQRFFATRLPWTQMLVKFFHAHLFDETDEYILAGDETVVSKAGRETFGVDRLFSGRFGKVIKGLGFFVFSLVNVSERKSYPLAVRQMVRSEAEKAAIRRRKKKRLNRKKKKKKSKPGKRGRKLGSRNRDKTWFEPSPELFRINEMLEGLLKLLRRFIAVKYLALDGHFGHHQAVLMALENGLHLISKMRRDSCLYERYTGKQNKFGPKRKYGAKLDYDRLPKKYLKQSEFTKGVMTNIYQGLFVHREFGCNLNVVIIVKINVKTHKTGHAILFSSDRDLSWEKLTDYYSLRFQIEFNFREAKQHFGLEDFMVTSETRVENAANLSFLMVLLSGKLIKNSNGKCIGINDLKTHYRGVKYVVETLKKVMKKPDTIIIKQVIEEVSRLGSIHQPKSATSLT